MKKKITDFLRAEGGIAAIETAFVLPIMLVMYIGMIDLTNLVSENRKLTQATAAVADVITQSVNTISKNQILDTFNAIDLLVGPDDPSNIQVTIEFYANGNAGAPATTVSRGTCNAVMAASTITDLMAAGNDLVVAKVCTSYIPYLGNVLGKKVFSSDLFTLKEAIAVRPRGSDRLSCTAPC